MVAQNTIPPQTRPKKTGIQGKLYLENRLYKFVRALENLPPNAPLDLCGATLLRKAVRDRLITKAQLGTLEPPRARYPAVLRFVVSPAYERRLQIFLTHAATDDINTLIRQVFTEMAQSHINRAVSQSDADAPTTARKAYLDFLTQYNLTEDDFDAESLKKSEYRLRALRNQPTVHQLKKNTTQYLSDREV